MGFVITNPLVPKFKNDEERKKFISEHTPGFLRSICFFGRDTCGYTVENSYDHDNPDTTNHRIYGDT